MSSTQGQEPAGTPRAASGPLCPFELSVDPITRFLNCELADDPTYDGLELQYFDVPVHGTGMLAFLSRRADRRVDYYHEPGLRLDQDSFRLGAGTGAWTETTFQVARLEIAADGVDAEVRFTDVDGRLVEVRVNDRDARRRRPAQLLAPVGASVDQPNALLLVWLHGFDLVRVTGTQPVIRIDGREASTGRLPGRLLHRRHLIKYAAPLCAAQLNRNHDGPLAPVDPAAPGQVQLTADRRGIVGLTAEQGRHWARFALDPALPDLRTLTRGAPAQGAWTVDVDGVRLTGGRWWAARSGARVELGLDVEQRWRPGPLPPLMRLVTTVVPDFRRWPTTYRWRAVVALGPAPTLRSRWERTSAERGDAYRRATGSTTA